MAQLKDLIVNGASRLIGDVFTNKIQITAISAPTASNGTTYGPGTNGQVLKSNGTSVYWAADDNSQTVTGVKGNSESSYRTGNVNITAANIGLGNVENTKLSTWAGSSNITTLGTISSGTVPWARLSGVPSSFTPATHTHYELTTIGDQRSTATTPNTYSNRFIFQGLKAKATIDSPSEDNYSYVLGLRGWSDSSGGDSHELAFNNTGLYWRHGATTSWGSWNRVYTTGNKPTASDVGLGNVENKSSATIRGELTSSNVTTALGFTPYNATNPNGYTSNTGTVTKVTAGTGLSIGTTAQGNFTTTGTINHTNSVTAQTTQAIYPIKIDAQGHISAYGTAVTPLTASSTLDATKLSGTIPASCYTNTTSFTITANATDGYWDLTGTNGTNAVTYSLAPYSSRQSSACFYTGTTAPNGTTRLNYNGYLYATKLYSGGNEVLTSHQSLTGYIPKSTLSGAYDIMYSSAANTPTRLAANTTSTKKFLRMTGTGSAGAAPAWDTVTKTDVGLSAVENKSSATIRGELTSSNVTTALGYTPADADDLSDYLPLTGGTLTGPLTIGSTLTFYEGSSFRIKYGTESPETAGLQNGDIYFYIQG